MYPWCLTHKLFLSSDALLYSVVDLKFPSWVLVIENIVVKKPADLLVWSRLQVRAEGKKQNKTGILSAFLLYLLLLVTSF